MKVSLPLDEMTVSEKIQTMETIWAGLSQTDCEYTAPEWHKQILEERKRLGESGKIGFTEWETAKQEIKNRILLKST